MQIVYIITKENCGLKNDNMLCKISQCVLSAFLPLTMEVSSKTNNIILNVKYVQQFKKKSNKFNMSYKHFWSVDTKKKNRF